MLRICGRSDYIALDTGCKSVALTALKLHERGRLSDGGLRLALAVTRRVRQLMPHASVYYFPLPKPLSAFGKDTPPRANGTEKSLEMLLDWQTFDLNKKAGPAEEAEFPSEIDVVGVIERVLVASNLSELVFALQQLRSTIVDIQLRFGEEGQLANGKLHVLALLHEVFSSGRLTPPSPRAARGEVDGTAWTVGATAQLQEQMLDVLIDLACEVAAASKSLPRTGPIEALDIIAVGFLLAGADALLMQEVGFGKDASKDERAKGIPRTLPFQEGYQKLGLDSRSYDKVSFADSTSEMPILWPGACDARMQLQAYFDSAEERARINFLDWKTESCPQGEVVYRIPDGIKPLDPSLELFRHTARELGYKPALKPTSLKAGPGEIHAPDQVTVNGKAHPPVPGQEKDFPDDIIRRMGIYKEMTESGVLFSDIPDKFCGRPHSHEIAAGWAFGSHFDNKVLARVKSLANIRDLKLLYTIMLEPANLNARPLFPLKKNKLCCWDRKNARPSLCGLKSHLDGSGIYHAKLVGVTCFNRLWKLGRSMVPSECNLNHPIISRGFQWDAKACENPDAEKTEDDVLHAPKIPNFGGALSGEDAEALLSFLSVPSVRASMLLSFFAENSRLAALLNSQLRNILWSAIFCPGKWPAVKLDGAIATPPEILESAPCSDAQRLNLRQGFLKGELRSSPGVIMNSLRSILKNAIDVASVGDFTSPYADILFFCVRLAAAILEFARFVERDFKGAQKAQNSVDLDGFVAKPSEVMHQELLLGIAGVVALLRKQVLPLVKRWSKEAMAAAEGRDLQSNDKAEAEKAAKWSKEASLMDRKEKVKESLERQEIAQNMSKVACAHIVLLTSPSLLGAPDPSGLKYPLNEDGAEVIIDYLCSMFYVLHWHGKGLGSEIFGSIRTPESKPPPYKGQPARQVWAGNLNIWPTLDLYEPTFVSHGSPGLLQIAPQELWGILAQRRSPVLGWFSTAPKQLVNKVLTALMRSALSEEQSPWEDLDNSSSRDKGEQARRQLGIFTANNFVRVDTVFASIYFNDSAFSGKIPMPDKVGGDGDLQSYLQAERGGIVSSVMPNVLVRERRRYLQTYLLPSVSSRDGDVDLKLWLPVPAEAADEHKGSGYIVMSGFPKETHGKYNSRYYQTDELCGGFPVYTTRTMLTLRFLNDGLREDSRNTDRWVLQEGDDSVAWYVGHIGSGKGGGGPGGWQLNKGDKWVDAPKVTAKLKEHIVRVSFGQYSEAPPRLAWDGIMTVHNGNMENESWIKYNVLHATSGLHALHVLAATDGNRPIQIMIGGKIVANVDLKNTGGFRRSDLKWQMNCCDLDLGPAGVTVVEFRSPGFWPHLSCMQFHPLDESKLIEGAPNPQDYTGDPVLSPEDVAKLGAEVGVIPSKKIRDAMIEAHTKGRSHAPSSTRPDSAASECDATNVIFRNVSYGGLGRVFRMGEFRNPQLESKMRSSVIPPETVMYGARYKAALKRLGPAENEENTGVGIRAKKWRLIAADNTATRKFWVVRELRFLTAGGAALPQRDCSAICSGSETDQLGPENALRCLPERHKQLERHLKEHEVQLSIPTGLQFLSPQLGASSTGYDIRSGSPGQVSEILVDKSFMASGGRLTGASFSYRYVIGYSGHPNSDRVGPCLKLVVVDDYYKQEHVIYTSPKRPARPYHWDSEDNGHPKNYSEPEHVKVTGLDIQVHDRVRLKFVIENNDRNMHLQGAEGENVDLNVEVTIQARPTDHTSEPWVGSHTMQKIGNADQDPGFWLGLCFPDDVEVCGFELQQGRVSEEGLYKDAAEFMDLQWFNPDRNAWETAGSFTAHNAALGLQIRRTLQTSMSSCILNMLSSSAENWVAELLYRISAPVLTGNSGKDHVVVLPPTKPIEEHETSATLLLCNPSKPSPNRWSLLHLNKTHNLASLFGLREYCRRMLCSLIWTSDYRLCKRALLPQTATERMRDFLCHPYADRYSGSFWDDQPSEGGWASGSPQQPSLALIRSVKKSGEQQQMIPARFIAGILPDVLTSAFRFWRCISGKDDGKIIAQRLADTDESWFGYDLQMRVVSNNEKALMVRMPSSMIQQLNSSIKATERKVAALRKLGRAQGMRPDQTAAIQELERLKEERRRVTADMSKGGIAATRNDVLIEGQLYEIVRVAPDIREPSVMIHHRLVDLTAPDVLPGTWLYELRELFIRIEDMSHILVWAAMDVDPKASKDLASLHSCVEIVELPRLRLRFTTGLDAHGRARLYSSEYSGFFIVPDGDAASDPAGIPDPSTGIFDSQDNALKHLCSVTPHSLLLGDLACNRYLLVPNCPYDPISQYGIQPWSTRLFPIRDDERWLSTFDSRTYLYKVHVSRLWLEIPSLEAGLLWAYLQLSDRRYSEAAQTIDVLSSDEPLTKQELFQLKQFEMIAGERDSDASVALKARLVLRFRHSPVIRNWPWRPIFTPRSDMPAYANPFPLEEMCARPTYHHTPACARFSFEEERELLKVCHLSVPNREAWMEACENMTETINCGAYYRPGGNGSESYRNYACGVGKDFGEAYDVLNRALRIIQEAETKVPADGWNRFDGFFLEDFRNQEYETLEEAKAELKKRQSLENVSGRPRGITFWRGKYGLRYSIAMRVSGSQETSWVYGKDPRGTRANLWMAQKVKCILPQKRVWVGNDLLGSSGLLTRWLDDDHNGAFDSLGFLFACSVLSGEGRWRFSVDGSQDNTQSLMGAMVQVCYGDFGAGGGGGCSTSACTSSEDTSVLMAILAILATHKIGAVPNFPSVDKLFRNPSIRKSLEAGKCAGSLPAIHWRVREEYDEDRPAFTPHLGAFIADAVKACVNFMNSKNEVSTRAGVGLFDRNLLPWDDFIMPPHPSLLSTDDTGRGAVLQVSSSDLRLQRSRPKPKDFSCSQRTLSPSEMVDMKELLSLGSYPMMPLAENLVCQQNITFDPALPQGTDFNTINKVLMAEEKVMLEEEEAAQRTKASDQLRPKLPLPLPEGKKELLSPIGSSMVQRLEKSMVDYHVRVQRAKREQRTLSGKTGAGESLYRECVKSLEEAREVIRQTIQEIEIEANRCQLAPNYAYKGTTGYLRFQIAKQAYLEPHVEPALVIGSVLAANGVAQIRDANPLCPTTSARSLICKASLLMFRSTKLSQLQRCIQQIKEELSRKSNQASFTSSTIASALCERRYWPVMHSTGLTFDPRFLLFEFTSEYMLWKRQVALVSQFSTCALRGGSETQQMLMGDGKTTVVGPLLALMLAEKKSPQKGTRGQLVTLVCPKALVQQSKNIMRAIFSTPVTPKPVFTLKFERGFDSRSSTLATLRRKLETARDECGIVIASPTSIKSYFLKYMELLIMLQTSRGKPIRGQSPDASKTSKKQPAWFQGPFEWQVGTTHRLRCSRPDASQDFIPSRLVLIPPANGIETVTVPENQTLQPMVASTRILRAWYGDPRAAWDMNRGSLVTNVVAEAQAAQKALVAGNGTFGDPCQGTFKQLLVEYALSGDEASVLQQIKKSQHHMTIMDEVELQNGIEFPLQMLPGVGAWRLVYVRGLSSNVLHASQAGNTQSNESPLLDSMVDISIWPLDEYVGEGLLQKGTPLGDGSVFDCSMQCRIIKRFEPESFEGPNNEKLYHRRVRDDQDRNMRNDLGGHEWLWLVPAFQNSVWKFIPSAYPGHFRICRFINEEWQHLGVHETHGRHKDWLWHPKMMPLQDNDDDHLWRFVKNPSEDYDRVTFTIIYAGPSKAHVGWVLRSDLLDVYMYDPKHLDTRCGGWRRKPTQWEVIDASREVQDTCLSATRHQRAYLTLNPPPVESRAWTNPFRVYHNSVRDDNVVGNVTCTRIINAIPGSSFFVHFCQGNTLETSVRSVRVPSEDIISVFRLVKIPDPDKSIIRKQDTISDPATGVVKRYWVALAEGGFPQGTGRYQECESSNLHRRYGGPPLSGSIILAMEVDSLPGPAKPKFSSQGEIVIPADKWCNIWTQNERIPIDQGWVEYAVHMTENALLDINIEYETKGETSVSMSLNGRIVDQALCISQGGRQWCRASGPFAVTKGTTRIRLISSWYRRIHGGSRLPQFHKLVVKWAKLQQPLNTTRAVLSATSVGATTLDVGVLNADSLQAKHIMNLVPEAFGVAGGMSFSPLTVPDAVLSCEPKVRDKRVFVSDDYAEGRGASGVVGAAVRLVKTDIAFHDDIKGTPADDTVVSVYVATNRDQHVGYIRFNYASGRCRSFGREADRPHKGPETALVPEGRFITGIKTWVAGDPRCVKPHLWNIQFHYNDGTKSPKMGRQESQSAVERDLISASPGSMITWLKFSYEDPHSECVVGAIESPAIVLPKFKLSSEATARMAKFASFIPRPSKWFEGTVAFELANFPGHFLVASKAVYSSAASGTGSPPKVTAKDAPLTIELLEPVKPIDADDAWEVEAPSLPVCEETFRRASFVLDIFTSNGDGKEREIQEIANAAKSNELDDEPGRAADEIAKTLCMWRDDGVLLMDEVDLLLHPLKSELNFPIGERVEIDVDVESKDAAGVSSKENTGALPKGIRWDLPIAVLDAIMQAHEICEKSFADGAVRTQEAPTQYVQNLVSCFEVGRREKILQSIPHFVVLQITGETIKRVLQLTADFMVEWLQSHDLIRWKTQEACNSIPIAQIYKYLMQSEGDAWPDKARFDASFAPATLQILTLARQWISCFLLHVLQKINRVNYGLLRGDQLLREAGDFFDKQSGKRKKQKSSDEALSAGVPPSRLLLALPFVGLEQPSESSEFAHPDVAIGLTILAFRHEGLREPDLRTIMDVMKSRLQSGAGPVEKRPDWLQWKRWVDQAMVEAPPGTTGVLPLDMFQPDNEKSFQAAYVLWRNFNPIIDHYLREHVFPRVMRAQELKISSSGQSLGSSLLFRSRLAFSGTPSDLLPQEEEEAQQLYPCVFEPGSEGRILATLTKEGGVGAWKVQDAWSVETILQHIALAEPRIDVLIDTGALITGKANREVAQYLLDHGLAWAKGVVFLDEFDDKVVLLRAGGEGEQGRVVKLAQCGLAMEDRFSFYDQVHTTGMDIKQHDQAVAVITVGKDTTLRDFAQGAYRMRGMAKGRPQKLRIFLCPEVLGLIKNDIPTARDDKVQAEQPTLMPSEVVRATLAWLLLNQIRLESKQMLQLAVQNVDSVTRRAALDCLLSHPAISAGVADKDLYLTTAFTEPVNISIPTEVPVPETFVETLTRRANENAQIIEPSAAGLKCITSMIDLAKETTRQSSTVENNEEWARRDLDAAQTRTQEREQELEQEKQKQREIEREASPWRATSRDLENPVYWPLAEASRKCVAFYPLSQFRLRDAPVNGNEGQDKKWLQIVVPNGVRPGDTMQVVSPSGKSVMVLVPPNAVPGTVVRIAVEDDTIIDSFDEKNESIVNLSSLQCPGVLLSDNFAARSFKSPRARRLRSLYSVMQLAIQGQTASTVGEAFTVALSLIETATVRRAISEGRSNAAVLQQLRLCLSNGTTLTQGASAVFSTASTSLQLLRFFDCQTSYNTTEGLALLRALAQVRPSERQRFFSTCVMSRRRDHGKWMATSLAPLMQLERFEDLVKVNELKRKVNEVLSMRGMNVRDLVRQIDANRDQRLDLQEIVDFLSSPSMQRDGMPSRQELLGLQGAIMIMIDVQKDGRISAEEFIDFLESK